MTTFTASNVRELANNFAGYSATHHAIGHGLLDVAYAYADRLEADEKAVPVYQFSIYNKRGELEWMTCSKLSFDKQPEESRRILYTHPAPADAERLAEALRQAMQSLRTIERGAMREEGLEEAENVRAYARSRAGVAESALAAHSAQAQTPVVSAPDAVQELADKYHELLWAVARKFPGETRHETALRYIREAECQEASFAAQENPNG